MGAEEPDVGPDRNAWGTWEELILGGAVLRHGTRDWPAISSELRARTLFPFLFTPQACKAKYEDLRRRYSGSGCTAWFEELRKRRVAELRRELEKSEDSIGSLESKLKRLKSEKENYDKVDYNSSRSECALAVPKSEADDSSFRETSKDRLSASSFTHDAQTKWSPPECRVLAIASVAHVETKLESSDASELEKAPRVKKLETGDEEGSRTPRKRRGKRKRKDNNWDARAGSIEESDNLDSSNVASTSHSKDNLGCDFDQAILSSDRDGDNKAACSLGGGTLMEIFSSIAENGNALVFGHRLDSQKRARYKKIIRRHLDFDTIRSRIASSSIKTTRELFRDLFLLSNNAIVFYSRRTREYKSAFALRDLVTQSFRRHCEEEAAHQPSSSATTLCVSPMYIRPVKPRSARPRPQKCKDRFSTKFLPYAAIKDSDTSEENHQTTKPDLNIAPKIKSLVDGKRGISQPRKVSSSGGPKIPAKERKRAVQR